MKKDLLNLIVLGVSTNTRVGVRSTFSSHMGALQQIVEKHCSSATETQHAVMLK